MSLFNEHQLVGIVVDLAPVLSTTQVGQKATVAAFFAELLKCTSISHMRLTNTLVDSLLNGLLDSTLAVRLLCIRGLGNIPIGVPGLMERHASDLLAAMSNILQSKDYHEEEFMTEVTSTLSKILDQLSVNAIGPIYIEIAKEIRSFFEFKSTQVRATAFTVFGTLAKCGHGHSRASFMEQIHLNMVSLLLHLNEESEEKLAYIFALLSPSDYLRSIVHFQQRPGKSLLWFHSSHSS
uniref:maestro heat-like repeat-containing protein family member 1 n=1 Tax=Pristiophorus japonicus TaxID=55135 RepID=UPI00398F274E